MSRVTPPEKKGGEGVRGIEVNILTPLKRETMARELFEVGLLHFITLYLKVSMERAFGKGHEHQVPSPLAGEGQDEG